ncbi:flagellar export protein FliJ [Methylophaga sp. OBS1]|uniref:flagellar export protein FliJ n=1 Tax=Methylophaga sp. OBS1 TaxID=2991933 RepID=UPI0022531933|nr:flagellar export protein FliJ [Methylophaga sp. OBS1]MCX4193866.1 flagellar export protein FliJ [Methylophaga sp. OBS1]
MSRTRKLNPVIDMARKATESELIKLGEQNALLQREQNQLDELIQYRDEYLSRFRQGDPMQMSAKKALDLRGFLAQLDQAIQAQEHQVNQSLQVVNRQQQNWVQARNKERALDTLMARYRADEERIEQKREQRENDEHTNAMWLRARRHD